VGYGSSSSGYGGYAGLSDSYAGLPKTGGYGALMGGAGGAGSTTYGTFGK
jgi:hypothetical protein